MKEIKLTRGKVALVDDEDYEFLMQWKWYTSAVRCGDLFYAYNRGSFNEDGKRPLIIMHRLILGITDKKILVDHKNHNGLDNRKGNLRQCSYSQNSTNRRKMPAISSKYLGVSKIKNKWRAHFTKNNKQIFLGYFDNEVDAALAYDKAAIETYGAFANPNFNKI